jgi:hypothetical protein
MQDNERRHSVGIDVRRLSAGVVWEEDRRLRIEDKRGCGMFRILSGSTRAARN